MRVICFHSWSISCLNISLMNMKYGMWTRVMSCFAQIFHYTYHWHGGKLLRIRKIKNKYILHAIHGLSPCHLELRRCLVINEYIQEIKWLDDQKIFSTLKVFNLNIKYSCHIHLIHSVIFHVMYFFVISF